MERSFFEWVALILEKYWPLLLSGTGVTLLLAISGTVIGFIIGLLIAVVRTIPENKNRNPVAYYLLRAVKILLGVYIEVFRGTPMIVQGTVIYYGMTELFGIRIPTILGGIFVISVNTGAYMAEIIRGGIISVEKGQIEGAQSIGMTHWQTMVHVVLPQAIRNIMPSIGNEFVINIKDSSVLNVISVTELFFTAKVAAGAYIRYFEVYFVIALIYLFLTFTITRVLRLIERRMDGPQNFVIHGSQSDSHAAIHVHIEKEGAPHD